MRRILLACTFLASVAGCASTPESLPTQEGVDLQAYSGRWHEQARLPNRFQKDCAGEVQAFYEVHADGTLGVTNQCTKADGSVKSAEAVGRLARSAGGSDPARLEVRFAPAWTSWLPMVWGDYWIMRIEGDYQYSLVGTPDRKYLWVLSREENGDPQTVKRLLAHAGSLGFPIQQVIMTGR
ncbi:lipocalin family protein [Yanghanlia caeni]|uniref:Outer membrane lipoprotein Blc n=1 Tax=Yanghanlia caeni TaxID=3064283 RepID=A0ABU1D4K3_9BURK|nr:lipocalin family protein [Alcaligenaceae bacterium LG-2]NGR09245.1 lipocalin family protein [bacterium SGD-2]HZH55849.1 lipocalin family protein [Burkholderiaceae bacterium]